MPERRADDDERRRRDQEMSNEVAVLKSDVIYLKGEVAKLVTRLEFAPVKQIVYGLVGTLLSGVIVGFLALVIRHSP